MKAGNRVRDGSISGTWPCTPGFLVTASGTTNELFLTAGYCAAHGVGNTWYHKGPGKFGAEVAMAYGWDGYDQQSLVKPE